MVTIVDYHTGNPNSIANMLKRIGYGATITKDPNEIAKAEKLIISGVGSFDYGITQLKDSGFFDILSQRVLVDKIPVLGICLGMQLFTESSEEGKEEGLGWIKGKTIRFQREKFSKDLKVPHMGWNEVEVKKDSSLTQDLFEASRFYFVHTYHVVCEDSDDELFYADYGYPFVAGVEFENIVGVQFHPEKSHKYGMKLLENFVKNY